MRSIVLLVSVVSLLALPIASSQEQPYDVCALMIEKAAHNVGVSTSSYDYEDSVYENYCRQGETKKNSQSSLGIDAIVEEIPIGFRAANGDSMSTLTNFCKTFSSNAQLRSASYSYNSYVVEKALTQATECVRILRSGNRVTHEFGTPDKLTITVAAGGGQRISIDGIDHTKNVNCVGKSSLIGTTTFDVSTSHTVDANSGSYNVYCTRAPVAPPDPSQPTLYEQASVSMGTSGGPYNILWPQKQVEPERDAEKIANTLESLSDQVSKLQSRIDKMVANYQVDSDGTAAKNPFGNADYQGGGLECPAGQYLAGLKIRWGGTCHSQCDPDGGTVRSLTPVCRSFFP
jgi:hypothetical protein